MLPSIAHLVAKRQETASPAVLIVNDVMVFSGQALAKGQLPIQDFNCSLKVAVITFGLAQIVKDVCLQKTVTC